MAVRLYPREYVERELELRKCQKVRDYGTASLWRIAGGLFYFTVPHEANGSCDENSLRDVLNDLELRKK